MSTAASRAMKLLDIIRPESIVVPLAATTKHEAIDALVDLLASQKRIPDAAALKRVVWEREMQRSTGIGEGLAIPHGKCPGLAGLVVAIGKPAEPIEFEAIDQKPVRLVILLASPADRIAEHIQALGRISRTMADPAVRNAAYACDSPAALYEIFRKADA
jgi:mannitol/fructose-specific phosphotransferase system IIA component (Ntr-type)